MTAAELITKVRESGGRPYRFLEPPKVFVITEKQALANRLIEMGGRTYRPQWIPDDDFGPLGSYKPARDAKPAWDIYIHTILVDGEQTIWEAAHPPRHLKAVG